MNKKNGGLCNAEYMAWSVANYGQYSIPADHQVRSPLTGSNVIDADGDKLFTCVELEVFALE